MIKPDDVQCIDCLNTWDDPTQMDPTEWWDGLRCHGCTNELLEEGTPLRYKDTARHRKVAAHDDVRRVYVIVRDATGLDESWHIDRVQPLYTAKERRK